MHSMAEGAEGAVQRLWRRPKLAGRHRSRRPTRRYAPRVSDNRAREAGTELAVDPGAALLAVELVVAGSEAELLAVEAGAELLAEPGAELLLAELVSKASQVVK